MRFGPKSVLSCLLLAALFASAEDADDWRTKGISTLKLSQSDPSALVDAARNFAKAGELYSAAGDQEKSVEMNSFLYWCKKKMTLQQNPNCVPEQDAPQIRSTKAPGV